jgi:hypothetical protein
LGVLSLLGCVASVNACGGSNGMPGAATGIGSQGRWVSDGGGSSHVCSDLFDQSQLNTFSIEMSDSEWAKLQDELLNHLDLVLQGVKFQTYHPITLHFGNEVTDARIRLKGQSSWYQTVTLDPSHPKGQFAIAFDQVHSNGTFHGVSKLDLDMPRDDWTFMHERLANNWFRKVGIMAPCSSSAKLVINGKTYGVYVAEESIGTRVIKDFFPANPAGDLWKGGVEPDTNKSAPNWTRLAQWKSATTIPDMLAIIDLPHSLSYWAGDALISNGDGFYGGDHNWYLYDQGSAGFVWLPADTDTTFDWLSLNSQDRDLSTTDHPIYWWAGRMDNTARSAHYLAVINDPTWRAKYVDAIEAQLANWDVGQMQSWLDTWSAQIADAVASDPNKAASVDQFQMAIGVARQVVSSRASHLRDYVSCERGGGGDDKDGDGTPWCDDCDDTNPAVHPGAAEICGNGVDDNCNGLVDEGC